MYIECKMGVVISRDEFVMIFTLCCVVTFMELLIDYFMWKDVCVKMDYLRFVITP